VSAVQAALANADSGKATATNMTTRTEVVVKETAQNILFETRDRARHEAWIHRNYLTK